MNFCKVIQGINGCKTSFNGSKLNYLKLFDVIEVQPSSNMSGRNIRVSSYSSTKNYDHSATGSRIFFGRNTGQYLFYSSRIHKRCHSTEDKEYENFERLENLLKNARKILQDQIEQEWYSRTGEHWDRDVSMWEFFSGPGKSMRGLLGRDEGSLLRTGNFFIFPIELSLKCAQCLEIDLPYELFEKLNLIEDKLWTESFRINDEQYRDYEMRINSLLREINLTLEAMRKPKPDRNLKSVPSETHITESKENPDIRKSTDKNEPHEDSRHLPIADIWASEPKNSSTNIVAGNAATDFRQIVK